MMQALWAETDGLARSAGMEKASPEHPIRTQLAADCEAWVAPYAWVLLWPVAEATEPALEEASGAVELHFEQTFPPKASRPGQVIDGYALLVLPAAPDPALRPAITNVQLKRRLCRRIVVWPDKEGWRGLEAVPCFGLPPAADDVAAPDAVALSPEEASLRDEVLLGGIKPVAEAHILAAGEEA